MTRTVRRSGIQAVSAALTVLLLTAFPPDRLAAQCPDGTPPPCRGVARPAAPPSNSVAVLYFDNLSRDTSDSFLASGLTEELIVRLTQVGRLDVRSRFEAQRFRGQQATDPRAIGRALRAEYLVTGTLQQAGQRVRLSVTLIRAARGAQVWGDVFDRVGGDLLEIQSQIAREVAGAITGTLLPAERASLARRPTSDAIAYDLYLRGIGASNTWSEPGLRAGLEFLERALARDSSFADAWTAKAGVWIMLADGYEPGRIGYAQARDAALQALRRDSANAVAWAILSIATGTLDFDAPRALEQARRSTLLDSVGHWPVASLSTSYLLSGRLAEAVAAARRSWQGDTLNATAAGYYLWTLGIARQSDSISAIAPRLGALLGPDDIEAQRGFVALLRGEVAEAVTRLRWKYYGGWVGAERVQALLMLGRRDAAVATVDSMVAEYRRAYFNAYNIAKACVALGDHDAALAWLERAYEQRTEYLIATAVDDSFQPLRGDPRFTAFLRKVGQAR